MPKDYSEKIAADLKIRPAQAQAVAALLADGGTVPFIARYRKEVTGELDEVQIAAVRDKLASLAEFDARRDSIIASLTERNLLTDELAEKIAAAETLSVLEDIYLPYKPKRRTKAMIARERGLEPLALVIFAQDDARAPEEIAAPFVNAEKEVPDADAALAGARDIIAEIVNEDAGARAEMRAFFEKNCVIASKVKEGKEEDGAKFRDYFDCADPLAKTPGHRLLAMLRGESGEDGKEGVLTLSIRPPKETAIELLKAKFVKGASPLSGQVALAVESSYTRMMAPSMEIEIRAAAFERASDEAIGVFAANAREVLMAAPLGRRAVLAIDPGIRTGCKVVCLDPQGKLLYNCVIQLSQSDAQRREAAGVLVALTQKFEVKAIAVGNGTFGRETMDFIRAITPQLPEGIVATFVSESGASIYSASEVAREEFPNEDVTVRGSVSIGRRLMDPLAELVKLDPKTIGVGQYQHDVDQTRLKKSLDDVVTSCVNSVGVEVNTASKQLLTFVAGVGETLAANIIKHRDENGAFKSRASLLKVPRLGPKAYEQCAGFLRVRASENPLDASAVHPERYAVVERMADDCGCAVADLMRDAALRAKIDIAKYVSPEIGQPTLRDIVAELAKPGRDPRKEFEAFKFAEGVSKIEDLIPGMKLPGVVTNVTNFGAFVDIGVHQDGLVHISELADKFVSDPNTVVKVGQHVTVTVQTTDPARKRIALTMKSGRQLAAPAKTELRRGANQPSARTSNDIPRKDDRRRDDRPPIRQSRSEGFNNAFSDFFNPSSDKKK